jgi:4a-hydroxytetrahydrobiopterin dehydratase
MTREPLTDEEIDHALLDLPTWTYDGTGLRRTLTCDSFLSGIRLVQAVAEAAEELDHHPDIDIRYRDVTFTCWTHTTGGVTDSDLELARRVEAIVTLGG